MVEGYAHHNSLPDKDEDRRRADQRRPRNRGVERYGQSKRALKLNDDF